MGYAGELVALSVSVCWAISSYFFEQSSRQVGSLHVNYMRLLFGFVLLGLYGLFVHGRFFPTGAGTHQWLWLSLSGFLGFFVGDLFLFKSYTVIGSRLAMLVMTFSPVMTALIGWVVLGESLQWLQWLSIGLIVLGVLMAFVRRNRSKVHFTFSFKGFLLAFAGAFGQSLGLVYSKKGIVDYDPFAATQIRIIAGFVAFSLLLTLGKRWGGLAAAFKRWDTVRAVGIGSFFGPGLGVALSLLAVTLTETGVASALMGLAPILLIVPAVRRGKRIDWREILGALIAVMGVSLLFL